MSAHALLREVKKNQTDMGPHCLSYCWLQSSSNRRYRMEWGLKKGRRRALRRVNKSVVKEQLDD